MVLINNIKVIGKTSLWVEFSDGKTKKVDISPFFGKGVFTQLKDFGYFQQVKNNEYFISWPNDQELSADTLYFWLKTRRKGV